MGRSVGYTVREVLGRRDYSMSETTRMIGESIGRPDLPYVQFPDADFKASLMQLRAPGRLKAPPTYDSASRQARQMRSWKCRMP
jgi:hypothetical protein